jgi:hypothetical protein
MTYTNEWWPIEIIGMSDQVLTSTHNTFMFHP